MPLAELHNLDLNAPYCDHWRPLIERSLPVLHQNVSVSTLLNQLKPIGFPKHFVLQEDLPEGEAYESFIFKTNGIPTRDGPHDYFNALCWFLFPQSKIQLNQIQATQIQRDGVYNQRGPIRDAITIIDENGLLLACSDELWHALTTKDWQRAFVELRDHWHDSQTAVFGHALIEKLLNPYKAICAHVLRVPQQQNSRFDLKVVDNWLSEQLNETQLATKPYIPVPIFGIPGWHVGQSDPDFYEDKQVFRPPQRNHQIAT